MLFYIPTLIIIFYILLPKEIRRWFYAPLLSLAILAPIDLIGFVFFEENALERGVTWGVWLFSSVFLPLSWMIFLAAAEWFADRAIKVIEPKGLKEEK